MWNMETRVLTTSETRECFYVDKVILDPYKKIGHLLFKITVTTPLLPLAPRLQITPGESDRATGTHPVAVLFAGAAATTTTFANAAARQPHCPPRRRT